MTRLMDLTGQRFGEWTVIERGANAQPGKTRWICRCSCGNEKVLYATNLRAGSTSMCHSCWERKACAEGAPFAIARRTGRLLHGLSNTTEYLILRGARRRCTKPNFKQYSSYGGRGIEYRLPDDLAEATRLLIASIGPRPEGMTLDRIDNDGHYEIGNLRWATRAQQQNNRRRRAAS